MTNIDWDSYEQKGGGGIEADRMWQKKGETMKPGDSIEGRYIKKETGVGDDKKNVYIIKTQGGEKVGVWGSTVIDSKFEDVAIGKMVALEYVGSVPSKNRPGKSYHDYKFGVGIDHVGDEVSL
jgi:hypothetical protein